MRRLRIHYAREVRIQHPPLVIRLPMCLDEMAAEILRDMFVVVRTFAIWCDTEHIGGQFVSLNPLPRMEYKRKRDVLFLNLYPRGDLRLQDVRLIWVAKSKKEKGDKAQLMSRSVSTSTATALTKEQHQMYALQKGIRTDKSKQLQRVVDPIDFAIFLKILHKERDKSLSTISTDTPHHAEAFVPGQTRLRGR